MAEAAGQYHTFIYNGIRPSKKYKNAENLSYLPNSERNVTFKIPKLVRKVGHIPDRYLDLLELASYVFCADRFVSRGHLDSPYFAGWHRRFRHVAAVRDYDFWSDLNVRSLLEKLLSFMSGDEHRFEFHPGHKTPKANMFDGPEFLPPETRELQVIMFSGGVDSTTGVIDVLANTHNNVILASHVSQGGSKKTQRSLATELGRRFPARVHHLMFECNLSGGERAREETQRTRSFLYTAVGAAIAKAYGQREINYFENGILSINLPPSEQFQNARATRTTHPKVLEIMTALLSLIDGNEFIVLNPFFWKTKTDIILRLKDCGHLDLLNNTVSCSRTFDKGIRHQQTHCGRCSQCIDRRFGIAAAGLLEHDNRGIYAYDFVIDNICPYSTHLSSLEERVILVDYIRLAMSLRNQSITAFEDKWLDQLTDVVDSINSVSDIDAIERLHELFMRHGNQVMASILAFQKEYADKMFGEKHIPNSLAEILSTQEYLHQPARLLAQRISQILSDALPIAFKSNKPISEKQVQDQVEALLTKHSEGLRREFPHVQFALGTAVPDFSLKAPCVYIEVKYLRDSTSPSKASEGIAADCTKYPQNAFLFFVVYDPERSIYKDGPFSESFEKKRDCLVTIMR